MSGEAWFTLLVVAVSIVALARDLLALAVVVGAIITLLVAGVITPQQALAGFSNPVPITPITVAALCIVARAVEKTGALQPLPLLTGMLGGIGRFRVDTGRRRLGQTSTILGCRSRVGRLANSIR
ncbi:MAG TPA: hypothetical protein VGW38_16545 [Chloroflexota bacterium]|nr:hypothetical protein [Chloroflexota bacterium]